MGIQWLDKLNDNIDEIGGKGIGLHFINKKDFPSPPAFILDTFEVDGFQKEILNNIEDLKLLVKTESFDELYNQLNDMIEITISSNLQNFIDELKEMEPVTENKFIIRSSAIIEDNEEASLAGIADSIVSAGEDISNAIKKVILSIYSSDAILYRKFIGSDEFYVPLAIIIQKFINADVSGCLLTRNPISLEKEVLIESNFGMGKTVMHGLVIPDYWKISQSGDILDRRIAFKRIKYSLIDKKLVIQKINSSKSTLDNEAINRLYIIAKRLSDGFKKNLEVEWLIKSGKIYLVQVRPMTGLRKINPQKINGVIVTEGKPVSPGYAKGFLVQHADNSGQIVFTNSEELSTIFKDYFIQRNGYELEFIPAQINPNDAIIHQLSLVKGIITNEGGITSHISTIAREIGIPMICEIQQLPEGNIQLDGMTGKIYEVN